LVSFIRLGCLGELGCAFADSHVFNSSRERHNLEIAWGAGASSRAWHGGCKIQSQGGKSYEKGNNTLVCQFDSSIDEYSSCQRPG
jgi:hypothetical protein